MKPLPIVLIIIGSIVAIAGLLGIIFFIDMYCDSPEDLQRMNQEGKVGDTLKVYGEIEEAPDEYDRNGWDDAKSQWNWTRYKYTFKEGAHFYSQTDLELKEGDSYVIDIIYEEKRGGGKLKGPHIEKNKDESISGPFKYRIPGILVLVVGLGIVGVGCVLIFLDRKKAKEAVEERQRKQKAIDKEMELLEKEIQMALTPAQRSAAGQQNLQYQAPPQQGQPQSPPAQQQRQGPPGGQAGPGGPPRPPQFQGGPGGGPNPPPPQRQ